MAQVSTRSSRAAHSALEGVLFFGSESSNARKLDRPCLYMFGISRGIYLLCLHTALSYNTPSNTLLDVDVDYVPERRVMHVARSPLSPSSDVRLCQPGPRKVSSLPLLLQALTWTSQNPASFFNLPSSPPSLHLLSCLRSLALRRRRLLRNNRLGRRIRLQHLALNLRHAKPRFQDTNL